MRSTVVYIAAVSAMAFVASPAPAATMMSCNGADLQKVNGMMGGMGDGQNKTMMIKEMTAANTAMSKGDMKGCAMHLNMAAKAGMAK